MANVMVYGHSDDLIEIEGAVSEELYANYNEPTTFTVGPWELEATYDGEWHFTVLDHPDGAMWEHLSVQAHADDVNSRNDYSESVRFDVSDDAEVQKNE